MATPYECREFGRGLILPTPMVELGGADVLTGAVTLTASSPRLLLLDASLAGFTVTLPAAPYEGMTFHFSENYGSANAVVLDGNGKNINGAATLTMNGAYRQRVLRYNGALGGQWVVIGGIA